MKVAKFWIRHSRDLPVPTSVDYGEQVQGGKIAVRKKKRI